MNTLAKEILWHFLSCLPAKEIEHSRRVCRDWRDSVDSASQVQWKAVYCRQVCVDLCVSAMFDWRRAAVCATLANRAVVAVCLWKGSKRMRVVVPWRSDEPVNAPLRNGVERQVIIGSNVEYIYDNAFRLRGLHRTCLHRQTQSPCRNCESRSKQKCLNPRYDYYLREIADDIVKLDESLGFRLAQMPNTPSGTVFDTSTKPAGGWYITTTGRTPGGSTVEGT